MKTLSVLDTSAASSRCGYPDGKETGGIVLFPSDSDRYADGYEKYKMNRYFAVVEERAVRCAHKYKDSKYAVGMSVDTIADRIMYSNKVELLSIENSETSDIYITNVSNGSDPLFALDQTIEFRGSYQVMEDILYPRRINKTIGTLDVKNGKHIIKLRAWIESYGMEREHTEHLANILLERNLKNLISAVSKANRRIQKFNERLERKVKAAVRIALRNTNKGLQTYCAASYS